MKKKIIFANMLIIAVVLVLSCQNDKEGRVPEQNYPIKIEFTNIAWDGNHNVWTNLDYDGKVIIINSIEELLNYVNSLDDNDYADIDFSKYSLLLASGISDYGISDIKAKTFQQLAENHYELEIEITLNDVLECEQWLLAIIVDKLSADSIVDLKVTTIQSNVSIWECILNIETDISIIISINHDKNIVHVKTFPQDLHAFAPEWMFLLHDEDIFLYLEDRLCLIENEMPCETSCFLITMHSPDRMMLEYDGIILSYYKLINNYIFNRIK